MTREDYLLLYEDRLLSLFSEHIDSINRTMLLVYAVAVVDTLIANDLAELLPLPSLRIDSASMAKLKPVVATHSPSLIGLALLYCSYSLYLLRKSIGRIGRNAAAILRENPTAKPVSRSSILLRRAGLAGMWLYLSRKLVEFFSRKGARHGTRRTLFAMAGLALTLLYLATIFLLPVYLTLRAFAAHGILSPFGWTSLLLVSFSALILILVIAQLIVRESLAYIASLPEAGRRNVFDWFFHLLNRLSALFESDAPPPDPTVPQKP